VSAARIPVDEVQLWSVSPEALEPEQTAEVEAWLSPAEHARRARLRHPEEFLAGRALLRRVLADMLGVAPREVSLREDATGRPELEGPKRDSGLSFNLSGTRGLVVCAVACDARVGVDVEDLGRRLDPDPPVARYFATPEREDLARQPEAIRSRRFLAYWTLKEAYLKALGTGLTLPLDHFWFELDDGPSLIVGPGAGPSTTVWHLFQRELPPHHLAALAVGRDTAVKMQLVSRAWIPGQD
jgi:4'-phosphopantetheinyl transferase